jgi:hypothetical protein
MTHAITLSALKHLGVSKQGKMRKLLSTLFLSLQNPLTCTMEKMVYFCNSICLKLYMHGYGGTASPTTYYTRKRLIIVPYTSRT